MRSSSLALAITILLFPTSAAVAHDQDDAVSRRRTPVVEVFESSRDAVVNISSKEIVTVQSRSPLDSLFDDFFEMPRRSPRTRQYTRTSVGSGFVIHRDGYLVTNAHVVARTAEQKVIFADGREYDAQVVASDTARDLAILKIDADRSLPTLPLGRSDDLMIGETVVAIGNPLGYEHTVTAGVVSAVGREVAVNPEVSFKGLIQTDASINPGNSGGPLLNVLGELIGINSAIRGDAQNIGFAIPVDQLREVLPDLLDVERRYRLVSGLVVDNLAEPAVKEVRPESPAMEAGIREGDVLLSVNSRPVRKGIDFDIALINHDPGDELDLTLRRDQHQYHTRLKLALRPTPDGHALAQRKLGLELSPLPANLAQRLGLDQSVRLFVSQVESGGPADEAGVEPDDILLALGRHYVSSVDDMGRLLESIASGDTVEVRLLRIERRRKLQLRGPLQIR